MDTVGLLAFALVELGEINVYWDSIIEMRYSWDKKTESQFKRSKIIQPK